MRMTSLVRFLVAFSLLAPAAFAAKADCAAAVTTQEAALQKADWVIEGKVEDIFTPTDRRRPPEVLLTNARAIVLEPNRVSPGKTIGIAIGPCFAGGVAAATRLIGRRMRFFGDRNADADRRFFYAEPAQTSLKTVPRQAGTSQLTSRIHRLWAENRLPDGWHHAVSTDGKFAVDLPAPFLDATIVKAGHATFLLESKDQHKVMFVAAYERSEPESSLAGSFAQEMAEPGKTISTFRGLPMVASRSPLPGTRAGDLISYSYMFKAPGGTYLLGIATPKEHEKASLRQFDRFLNSLQFE